MFSLSQISLWFLLSGVGWLHVAASGWVRQRPTGYPASHRYNTNVGNSKIGGFCLFLSFHSLPSYIYLDSCNSTFKKYVFCHITNAFHSFLFQKAQESISVCDWYSKSYPENQYRSYISIDREIRVEETGSGDKVKDIKRKRIEITSWVHKCKFQFRLRSLRNSGQKLCELPCEQVYVWREWLEWKMYGYDLGGVNRRVSHVWRIKLVAKWKIKKRLH